MKKLSTYNWNGYELNKAEAWNYEKVKHLQLEWLRTE